MTATVDTLQVELSDREAEIRGLRDDVTSLQTALRPFAEAAAYYDDSHYPDANWPTSEGADEIRLGHLRNARDVLDEMIGKVQ